MPTKKPIATAATPGARLIKLREKMKLTQEGAAEGADISVRALRDYESDKAEPTPRQQRKLAGFFGVDRKKIF